MSARLKYHDPALALGAGAEGGSADDADSAEPSPRHAQQWLADVTSLAHVMHVSAHYTYLFFV